MQIASIQSAIFTSNTINDPKDFFLELNGALDALFTTPPQVNSLHGMIPPEIPRVVGSSDDGRYTCNIGLNKIDFFVAPNLINDTITPAQLYEDLLEKTKKIIKFVSRENQIVRFGIVGNFYEFDKSPSNAIRDVFFKNNNESLSELSIRKNTIIEINGIKINQLINISNGEFFNELGRKDIVTIQLDYNNSQLTPLRNESECLLLLDKIKEAASLECAKELFKK